MQRMTYANQTFNLRVEILTRKAYLGPTQKSKGLFNN